MKKFLVITVLALLALSVISAAPVLAANELTFDADTTINIPDLSINLTIKSGSVVDAMVANSGTITFTFSTGNNLIIESSDQRNMALSPALAGQSFTCGSLSSLTVTPQAGVSGVSVILTPSTAACSSSGGSTSGSSSSGGGSSAATPAEPAEPATPSETPAKPATPAEPASAAAKAADQIKNIVAEAATIAGRSVEQVLAAVGSLKDAKAEAAAETKYTAKLVSGIKNVTAEVKSAITTFVNYGTPTTKILGAGERAGVVNSYKSTFGKVPSSEAEWSDVIKIANGRWPSEKSAASEAKAATEFKKVYKRSPDMKQPNDNAAVTVISYGLRPSARNTNSEKAAIKSFKAVYGHAPVSAVAWDIVRAIAYSGAKR